MPCNPSAYKGDGENRILALTETGLKEDKHPRSEIMKHFPHHHLIRQDRKKKKGDPEAEDDVNHLGKSGGCLLLSSNQLPIKKIDKDSNGNVEYLIAEAPTLKAAIIIIYNPPSNFCLTKFKEALGPINTFLTTTARKQNRLISSWRGI